MCSTAACRKSPMCNIERGSVFVCLFVPMWTSMQNTPSIYLHNHPLQLSAWLFLLNAHQKLFINPNFTHNLKLSYSYVLATTQNELAMTAGTV